MNRQAVISIRGQLTAGKLNQALQAAQRLTVAEPDSAEHWLLLSEVQIQPKVSIDALPAVRRALELDPDNERCLAHLASCLLLAGEFSEAQAVATRVLNNDSNNTSADAETLDKLGNVLNGCGELDLAHDCFVRAVDMYPDSPHYLFNLAALQRALGKMKESEACFSRVIAIRPDDSAAHLARSSLRTVSESDNHVEELEDALHRASPNSNAEIRLCFALAKELEDLGDHPRSFSFLRRGSDIRRRRMDYDVDADVEAMAQIAKTFSADRMNTIKSGYETDEPIFILGLPRTGTTLVERIVSSHSNVFAAGELQNFAIELIKIAQRDSGGGRLTREQLIASSAELDYHELGKRYVDSTRPRTGRQARFIDKLPLNFLYTGLIHKALPGARIIHLTRQPMDACYAIYKTLFQQVYPFSYDLTDLGRYYIAYRKLMAHWENVLQDRFLNVSYEGLIENQERVSREIISFCSLEWQEQCLDFQNNRKPTATASASQVRQGIYTSSVERWRYYEFELAPLKELLEGAGLALDHW